MFSRASEYALRAVTELARRGRGQYVLARQMAEILGVSVHYLSKVMQRLAKQGILKSQAGSCCGFALAREPEDVSPYDIVAALNDISPFETCVMGEGKCAGSGTCPMHTPWDLIRNQFVRSLQSMMLAEMAAFQTARSKSAELTATRDHPAQQSAAKSGRKSRPQEPGR